MLVVEYTAQLDMKPTLNCSTNYCVTYPPLI